MAGRCDKLADIDVSAYLEAPEDERWSTMRSHVEKCRDCSEEIEAWRSLRASLVAGGDGHPAEELLLAYADERSTLATSVVEGIESHLAECVSCRDEVGVLGTVAIQPEEAADAERAAASVSARAEGTLWRRVTAALSGPVWRPALAVAVLVVLLAPALKWIDQRSVLMQLGVEPQHDAMMVSGEHGVAREMAEGAIERPAPTERGVQAPHQNIAADTPAGTPATVPASTSQPPATPAPSQPPAAPRASAKSEPLAKRASNASARSTPVLPNATAPPTTDNSARLAPSREDQTLDLRQDKAQIGDDRGTAWFGGDRLSTAALNKDRRIAPVLPAPVLDFVPGGRAPLPVGEYDQVVLRVRFLRVGDARNQTEPREAEIDQRSSSGEDIDPVVISPEALHIEVRIMSIEGREHHQRVDVRSADEGPAPSAAEILIPAEWLTRGENRVRILGREGRELARPFSIVRP